MNYSNENIFTEIQEKYNVKEVAEQLGIMLHRVGGSYRANSIFGNGEGENAFAVYPENNRWYDFMNKQGGDIVDLVATVKFNGDKGAAIRELMPEYVPEKIKIQKSQRDEFMKDVERWHNELFSNKPYAVRALAYLHSRGINDETIRRNKIGIKPQGPSWRLVLPYMDESGTHVLYFNTRCYDWGGKGENPNEQKYMKASHEKYSFLKNSIQGLHTLDRGKDFVVITEGTFDALSFDQAGYSVLCTNGGDFGKLTSQAIEKMKDFKKVVLAFDQDEAGKGFTYKMARELIKEHIPFDVIEHNIGKDISDYYQVKRNLDELIECPRMGTKWVVEECLAPQKPLEQMTISQRDTVKKHIKEFILEISPFTDDADITDIVNSLDKYFDKTWLNDIRRKGQKGMTEMEVIDVVKAHHKLIYNEKCGFYEYEDGVWKEKMNDQVGGHIMDVYGMNATGSKVDTTLRLLKKDKSIWSEIPLKGFNMLPRITLPNGTLHVDLETGTATFKQHSADDYTTVKLPYRYDENATCPNIEKFLDDVTCGNRKDQMLLEEFLGYLLLPDCRFQKALMLIGQGSNGKSVFVNLAKKMLGGTSGYVSTVEPSKLSKEFRLMPFKNSWLNISTDAESDLRGAEGEFKKIVAGEELEDSYKFHSPFSFPTRSKMMMCCNYFPTVADNSEGFMRRFLILNFKRRYVSPDRIVNENDRPIDINLEAKLEKELPGLLNLALKGLQRLLAQGHFTTTDEQEQLINEFIGQNVNSMTLIEDHEELFFEVKDTVKEGRTVDKRQVFSDYKKWSEATNEIPMSRKKFYSAITAIFARLGWKFKEKGNFWKFEDIKLANNADSIKDADKQNDEIKNGDIAAQE